MYNPYNYISGMNTTPYPYNTIQNIQPQQNIQPPQPMFNQSSSELIRVTGLDGAKAYQMPPNGVAALFDNNEDLFYIKTTDGAGFPTIRTYRFTAYDNEISQEQIVQADYITREEFEQFKKEMLNNGKQYLTKPTNTNGKQNKSANDKQH